MLEILIEMKGQLASLDANLAGVKDHLAKLNGSVARHEQRLSEVESHHNFEAGEDKANAAWMKVIRPALYFIGGGILTLAARIALENSQCILKALFK